jgi:hypothetical protein
MKKVLAIIVVLALCLSLFPSSAFAATLRLSNTSLTLNEGGSYRLSVNTTSSIKWSTSNKNVATVSSKGTVKAVKEGNATITAVVSKKKLTCKVRVKDVLTGKEAAENITYETHELQDQLIIILQNKNKVNIQAEIQVLYYDNNDSVISTESGYIWTFESGKKAVEYARYPLDDNYNPMEFSRYEIKIKADVEYVSQDKIIDQISLQSNKGSRYLVVTATNEGDEDISSIDISVLYYIGGKIVSHSWGYFSDIPSGENDSTEILEPYDENYDKLPYDDYEIFINEAR